MKRFFIIFNLSLNFLCIGSLLLSGFSTQINPERFVLPSYLGLVFIPLLIINLLFIFFWGIKLKWYFVFSLFAVILMYPNIKNDFPFNGETKNQIALNDSTQITLLSYNVKLFDFFKKSKKQENYNKTVNYILKRDADIVCLQEFGYYNSDGFLNAANILSVFGKKYKYRHIEYYLNSNKRSTYGVATFSKYPIINKRTINYNTKFNFTICSDINVRNKIIHLFNCHLESNQLTLDDKKMMMELVDSTSQDKITKTTGLLMRKLGIASKQRAHQANVVSTAIKEYDSNVILCGDFNDSPISYTYKRMKGDLVDVFVNTSSGLGISYNELPFLYRIDYIFHSKTLSSGMFKVDKVKYSDHYPISCVIDLK